MGEGPCWKGLGLLASGVAGDGVDQTRPAGWIAPGRVWRDRERGCFVISYVYLAIISWVVIVN